MTLHNSVSMRVCKGMYRSYAIEIWNIEQKRLTCTLLLFFFVFVWFRVILGPFQRDSTEYQFHF